MAIDRRLGDYFANAIDRDGNVYISVSDTAQGGSVSLPRVIRQTGGPTVGDPFADAELWGGFTRTDTPAPAGETVCASGILGAFRTVTRFLGLSQAC